jgi:DNA invertase Pin-like site-specific DNA recombinase
MVRERTKAGMDAARARGRRIGRPPKLNKEQRQEIVETVSSGRRINAEAALLFRVSGATVTRTLAMARYTSVSDEDRLAQAVSSPAANER